MVDQQFAEIKDSLDQVKNEMKNELKEVKTYVAESIKLDGEHDSEMTTRCIADPIA